MFQLLAKKEFGGYFWTQFLGAFNDNLFKNALLIMLSFRAASESESGLIANLAAGCFILPFFIFSPLAGQIADKFDKDSLIRKIKIAEIVFMAIGSVGFYLNSPPLLFVALFLMGSQSAFFGPIKYSLLPDVLHRDELVSGNSLVELGTFLAILLGTIAGGLLTNTSWVWISASTLGFACLGVVAAFRVPIIKAADPTLKILWNPFPEFSVLHKIASRRKSVYLSILAVSWFWFFGAVILTQIPVFSKYFLHADASAVTLLLATFSLSIGFGSWLCEWLSRKEIEIGLVPLGAIGMTLFCFDFANINYLEYAPPVLFNIHELWLDDKILLARVIFDTFMMGACGALYIVPLYALIQDRSAANVRSRVIAANNIANAIFMVLAAIFTVVVLNVFNGTTLDLFLYLSVMNALISIIVFTTVPEFTMRFLLWIIASTIYNIQYENRKGIPREGAVFLTPNHVSFIDWFLITALCRRPPHFVMHHSYFNTPVLKYIFKMGGVIPITSEKENPKVKEQAFLAIKKVIDKGGIICIFPEGQITHDGELSQFKRGIERLQKDHPEAAVVPVALCGLWGGWFSRSGRGVLMKRPKNKYRKVSVKVGQASNHFQTADQIQGKVKDLIGSDT